MSVAVAQDRLKRLTESGLRGACRPGERTSQLRKVADRLDETTLRHAEDVFAALGDRTRLKILSLIAEEELCACEVMVALELTQPTTSHHLGILERTGLVSSRREGKWVFYTLANPRVKLLLSKGLEMAKEGV